MRKARGASDLPDGCATDQASDCALCHDAAVMGIALDVDRLKQTAVVRFGSDTAVVALDLVDAVYTGDTLLVHQGFAVARLET